MKMLVHKNIVSLKEYFFKSDEINENDVYLNLVLEYVPDTVFNASQTYIKHKQLIPHLHVKVSSVRRPLDTDPDDLCVLSIALHVSTASVLGLSTQSWYLSSRHQTTEPAPRPCHRSCKIM